MSLGQAVSVVVENLINSSFQLTDIDEAESEQIHSLFLSLTDIEDLFPDKVQTSGGDP